MYSYTNEVVFFLGKICNLMNLKFNSPVNILSKEGVSMKKVLIFIAISLFIVGCSSDQTQGENSDRNKNPTLNISLLSEEEVDGDFDAHHISYKAPSLEVALEALPFKVNLPKDLPFEAEAFKPMKIWDWSKDGKEIEAEFWTVSNSGEEGIIINVWNFDKEAVYQKGKEEINITDDIIGHYVDSSLAFEVDGVNYLVSFPMEDFENSREELIKIAKQII